jgi:hypothetical protein
MKLATASLGRALLGRPARREKGDEMLRRESGLEFLLIGTLLVISGCASSPRAVQGPKGKVLDIENRLVGSVPPGLDVFVRQFSTDGVDLGSGTAGGKENRVEAAEKVKASGPGLLATSVALKLKSSKLFGTVSTDATAVPSASSIVVEGRFLAINPGSRAKRYWVGFGAGRSGVYVAGRVLDSEGKVLAEFQQGRHSGVGFYGGSYVKFLTDDVEDIGADIADFLIDFVKR